jgi:peptide/nickel transport system substrate-binding protein
MPGLRRRQLLQATAGLAMAGSPSWGQAAQGVLQVVAPWEVGGLSPARTGHLFCRLQVCETLVEVAPDGRLAPGLAQAWSCSADGLAWRFDLRRSARFHDGTAVTAPAVLACLEAARRPPSLLSQAPIERLQATDPHTLQIRLTRPHGGLPHLLTHSTTLILAPASFAPGGAVTRLIGSGPYKVLNIQAPQRMETQAFAGHDGPPVAIQRVHYLAAGRAETRALMALSGQADLAYGLDPVSLARVRRDGRVALQEVTLPRTLLIKLNAGLPSLGDLRLRQALSLAIDRVGIARALLRDPAMAATQLLSPSLPGWHDPSLPPLRHDPVAARALLMQAGWQSGPDGICRNAQGQRLRLPLRTFSDRPELPLMATALQAQWRSVGIEVPVSVGNSGDIPLGHRDGSLVLALSARNFGTVPDPSSTLWQDFGPHGGDWGAMGWHNPGLVTALKALQALPSTLADTPQARQHRHTVVQALQSQLPVIPLAWSRLQVATSPRVLGVSLDPLERSYRLSQMRWQHTPA